MAQLAAEVRSMGQQEIPSKNIKAFQPKKREGTLVGCRKKNDFWKD